MVERARSHDLPVIPGAVTATEVQVALGLGVSTVKFFPAASCGGPAAVRALAAPFPELRIMPTGGVTPESLPDYLSLPSVLAVGGSWMVPQELVAAHDEAALAEQARHSAALVAQIRG
ncbi:bifunctional 4-hydroxy-2-oxoglutarate aldolase/2-dehydro-3-deoxy-phosphogluconate aldolase [Nesterenkonia suensis]